MKDEKSKGWGRAILRVGGWVVVAVCCVGAAGDGEGGRISGKVLAEGRGIAGVRVRVPGQATSAMTDDVGKFALRISSSDKIVTAAKAGYRIANEKVGEVPLELRLQRLPEDHPEYAWIDPSPHVGDMQRCGNCHRDLHAEWSGSAHGRAAKNPRFLSLFSGENGKHKTWNAQAEHPLGAGVCAACHVPTLTSPDLTYDVRKASGADAHGVHCDFCHKIASAPMDKLGTRFGKDGYELIRPAKGDLLSFGPLDDAVRAGESFGYAPFYRESRYCASCHEGVVFGVRAYGTYSEWLESPAKREGKQCQTCHMPSPKDRKNVAPEKGGIERDPATLSRHDFPGATEAMLRSCLKLDAVSRSNDKGVSIEVRLVAENVGHRVPTGFIDRHLILVIEASDADGKEVQLLAGARLPKRAGALAGKGGAIFGKQHLSEGGEPLPFWVLEGEYHDTRLQPGVPIREVFRVSPQTKSVRIRVLYGRFWPAVAEARRWEGNQIEVIDRTIVLNEK